MQQRSSEIVGLVAWITVCTAGGGLIGILTGGGETEWYRALSKPSWNPPGWVFGPVWTALYATMGIAAWRVWRHGGWRTRTLPLNVFLVQLGLNWVWSCLFFTLQSPFLALVDIIALWSFILLTVVLFARVEKTAAWLLAPYLAWVTFATVLNAAIVGMN